MPRGDGTGPEGKGPRTGRGLGPCRPSDDEEQTVSWRGRRIRGNGWRRPINKKDG